MEEDNVQPTFKRQRFLLAFIHQLEDDITETDLQKLVFLDTMRKRSDYYEFIPYKSGPHSFQLARDLEILNRDGYLTLVNSRSTLQIRVIGNRAGQPTLFD